VATGVVPDYPVNINKWLTQMGANPDRYGEYLGSEYPIAQTLRLEFLNSLQLLGTGVVSALQVAFHRAAVPRDWQKLDRLTRGISHFWWQQHDSDSVKAEEVASSVARLERVGSAGGGGSSSSTSPAGAGEELAGVALLRCLGGVEGLHQLLFSTLLLHQWFQAGHQLTYSEWTQLNTCIDARGTDVPMQVQRGIYDALARECLNLVRPQLEGPVVTPALEGWASIGYSGRAQVAHEGDTAGWFQQTPRLLAAQGGVASAGRASLAPGGLEPVGVDEEVEDGEATYHVAQVSPLLNEQMFDESEERAWVAIHQSVLLLAPSPNALPYGFVSLSQAVVARADGPSGQLSLKGRATKHSPTSSDKEVRSAEKSTWVELCLLLSDGRYQLLEAPKLDIRISSTEFDSWAKQLRERCVSTGATTYRV